MPYLVVASPFQGCVKSPPPRPLLVVPKRQWCTPLIAHHTHGGLLIPSLSPTVKIFCRQRVLFRRRALVPMFSGHHDPTTSRPSKVPSGRSCATASDRAGRPRVTHRMQRRSVPSLPHGYSLARPAGEGDSGTAPFWPGGLHYPSRHGTPGVKASQAQPHHPLPAAGGGAAGLTAA